MGSLGLPVGGLLCPSWLFRSSVAWLGPMDLPLVPLVVQVVEPVLGLVASGAIVLGLGCPGCLDLLVLHGLVNYSVLW